MQPINRRVTLVFHLGERYLNRVLAPSGLSSGTAPLLLEVRAGEGRSLAAIAGAVDVDKAYVSRGIHRLERAGFVTVAPSAADGRSLTVSLTAAGRDAAGQVEEAMRAWLTIVSQGVDQADLDTVNAVFDRFYANAQAYFNHENQGDTAGS